ncbi:MAG: DHH family phosphoesterase [Nanoarchaeota archaeon]
MLTEKELKELRDALINSARPLIFFDDDPDGLCSFLQFYRLNPESHGVVFKKAGSLNTDFLRKVEEYQPDTIFILDIANVDQEFLDGAKNVYWLDHHTPSERRNVKYYNPMINSKGKDNRPVSYWAYKVARESTWLAMAGCVGDWFLPEDIRQSFEEEYPNLIDKKIKTPEHALFESPIGLLARALSFILKGMTKEVMAVIKVLTRIKDPNEILDQSSSKGKFIWKKYKKMEVIYKSLIDSVQVTEDKIILFKYSNDKTSLTSDLSNELLFKYPKKFIIIAREKNGEMKCSLRSSKYEVRPILEKALKDVQGYGGGHLHACGAAVKIMDFNRFLENIRQQL